MRNCDFCCKRYKLEDITRVTWKQNNFKNYYCKRCLEPVLKDAMTLPWHKEHGYELDWKFD